jgi:hypothetical protein
VASIHIPFCLLRLSVSVYYTVDVGFQENEITLTDDDNFRSIDFTNNRNLVISESRREEVGIEAKDGVLYVSIKKLRVHRKFVARI